MAQGTPFVSELLQASMPKDGHRLDLTPELDALAREFVTHAEQVGDIPQGALLWAHAGEVQEFGLDDAAAAFQFYRQAVAQPDAPACAFAGLRRLARQADSTDRVGALYGVEYRAAGTLKQRIRTAVQSAIWTMRSEGTDGLEAIVESLGGLEPNDPALISLKQLVQADLAILLGQCNAANDLNIELFELAERVFANDTDPTVSSQVELSSLAAKIALIYCHLSKKPDEAAQWLEKSLALCPSESALRELSAIRFANNKLEEYAGCLTHYANSNVSQDAKARAYFELGMLRTHRLDDQEGAQQAFLSGLRLDGAGAVCAAPFLALTHRPGDVCSPREVVDALGFQAELAATKRERSDSLYRMAVIFDRDLHRPDAAVEILRDAINTDPTNRIAARTLVRLYQRSGAFVHMADLLEAEVDRYPDSRRLRLKLAEIYQDRLSNPDQAERHLRVILKADLYKPAVVRFHRLLVEQNRFLDLFEHLSESADRETDPRERLYDLERAAQIAETRLNQPQLAIDRWREIHEIDPGDPSTLAALGRLLSSVGNWEDLIVLNCDEIAVREDPTLIARLHTKNGEVLERYLNDEERAQAAYELALEVLPTYEPALEALGRILWRNHDWSRLTDMYHREIEGCCDPGRRIRRLLDLGELQATYAQDLDAALMTFETVLADEPGCEEALLWLERLYLAMGDHFRLLKSLENRLELAPEESRAAHSLRAGSIAEWALGDVARAWKHYLNALDSNVTRSHVYPCLIRLLGIGEVDDELRDVAVAKLFDSLGGESDPILRGQLQLLIARLQNSEAPLEAWAAKASEEPADFVAAAGSEIDAVLKHDVERIADVRAKTRLGSLWALIAQVDDTRAGESADDLPEALPSSPVTLELLAEMDVLETVADMSPLVTSSSDRTDEKSDDPCEFITFTDEVDREKPHTFRSLLRSWMTGAPFRDIPTTELSIPSLRLLSSYQEHCGDDEQKAHFHELESERWAYAPIRQELLTKAAEHRYPHDPEKAVGIFERALACNCFSDQTREELYAAIERVGELEALTDGLVEHVAHTSGQPEQAKWLQHLALTQERVNERGQAIESWQGVVEHLPTDILPQLEKTRLLVFEDRLEEARQQLEAALKRPFSIDDRLVLLGKLADLQLMDGGNGERAVSALDEAVRLSERQSDWVLRLARAHYHHGVPEQSVALLVEALPGDAMEEDLPDWFLMARLKYLRLNDDEGARELLWGLFQKYPGNRDALKELETYYRKQENPSGLAERLSAMLVNASEDLDQPTRAFLWEYLGDLNFQVLRRNRDAEIAYEAAEGLVDQSPRLQLKTAQAVARQTGKAKDACARFKTALRRPDVGVLEWTSAVRDLETLFESIADTGRVRVMRQIGDLLRGKTTPDEDEARIKRDPARSIDTDIALEELCEGLAGRGSIEVIRTIVSMLERCFGDRRARKRALGGRRIRSSDSPRLTRAVDLAAETLKVPSPKLFMGNGNDHVEWLSNGGFWFPIKNLELADELTLRFWAGHVTALSALGLGAVSFAEPGEIEEILCEILRLEEGKPANDDRVLKEVSASRHSDTRKELAGLLEIHPDLVQRCTSEDWPTIPTTLADRFGLLMSGDVRASVDAILSIEDDVRRKDRAERAISDQRCRSLFEYAFGQSYHQLRYKCGLGAKPKVL